MLQPFHESPSEVRPHRCIVFTWKNIIDHTHKDSRKNLWFIMHRSDQLSYIRSYPKDTVVIWHFCEKCVKLTVNIITVTRDLCAAYYLLKWVYSKYQVLIIEIYWQVETFLLMNHKMTLHMCKKTFPQICLSLTLNL